MLNGVKSILICFTLLFGNTLNCFADSNYFDSLRIQLIGGSWNDDKIEKYDRWLSIAIQINHDSINEDLERLNSLRNEHKSDFIDAVYLSNYAYRYTEITGDYQKGLALAQEAKTTFERGNHTHQLVIVLCRIAFYKLWNEISRNRKALDETILNDYLLPAEELANNSSDTELKIIVLQWLGSYYNVSKNDNQQALRYFFEAEKLQSEIKNPLLELTTLASIGIINSELCDEEMALLYLQKCEKNIYSNRYPYALGNLYRSIANYFLKCKNDSSKALDFAQKSYALALQLKAPTYISLSQQRLYEIHKAMGQKDEALNFLELHTLEEEKIARDKFEFAYSQYDLQKKEKIILEQKLEIQENRTAVIILIASIVILTLMIIVVLRIRKRNQKIALKEAEEKNKQALEIAVRETEEEERKRISENLHNSVVQSLVVAKMNLQSLDRNGNNLKENKDILNNVYSLIEDSTTEIRRISHTILPASFDIDGLGEVVKELGSKLINSSVKIEVFENGDFKTLPKNLAIIAYRIIQECLQNALKYAQAKNIHISLVVEDNHLEVSIEDDGIGFEKKAIKSEGIGLKSIQNRIEHLSGHFALETEANKGTFIQFQLPYVPTRHE